MKTGTGQAMGHNVSYEIGRATTRRMGWAMRCGVEEAERAPGRGPKREHGTVMETVSCLVSANHLAARLMPKAYERYPLVSVTLVG